MFKIYITVKRLLVKNYSEESEEFKKGWKKACEFLMLGIKKSTQYNLSLLNRELEDRIKSLEKTIAKQRNEISALHEKLDDKSLVNVKPEKEYRTFVVEDENGEFEIITNMSKDSFEWCLFNFRLKNTYKRLDECKSKLLMYINNKNALGFKAFKDRKAYNRFLNGKV